MSETTKWTPGPWTIHENDDDGETSGWIENKEVDRIVCDFLSGMWRDEESQANARLVAAAPALYEALAEVTGLLVSMAGRGQDGAVEKAIRNAERAQALARGESPSPEATLEVKP